MINEDKIKELFAEKLGNLEAPVNPELWSAISSQIGTVATVTSTGLSIVAKTIIGISAATVIGVSTYFITRNTDEEQQPQTQQTTQLVTEEPIVSAENLPAEEVVESVKEQVTNKGAQNSVRENTSHTTPLTPIVPVKPIDILLDNSTFIANSTQDLIKDTKTEPIVPPVKNETKTEAKHEQIVANNSDLGEEAPLKPSFEITHLPNIYGLYAGGYFSIDYKGAYSDFQITILDSRNNVVFSSDRPDFEWRGADMSGNQVEPGKYVYIITAKDLDGNAINKYSPLTVINQ